MGWVAVKSRIACTDGSLPCLFVKETQIFSIPAQTALAQAKQVKPSRGQIPADCALFSVSLSFPQYTASDREMSSTDSGTTGSAFFAAAGSRGKNRKRLRRMRVCCRMMPDKTGEKEDSG
jgi:hypothetical protein